MKHLHQMAASAYMGLCRESLYIGSIGPDTFLTRIGALLQMCNPETLLFMPTGSTGLQDWEFDKGAQIGLIPSNLVIKLWNLKKLRDFALDAIEHYSQQNPHWRWRVTHPKRLPKLQKKNIYP